MIIGGGYISLEMAQIFPPPRQQGRHHRDRGALDGKGDADVSAAITEMPQSEGIDVYISVSIAAVKTGGN